MADESKPRWHRRRADPNRQKRKNVETAAAANSRLDAIQNFERDVDQNHSDARFDKSRPAEALYIIREYLGAQKSDLLSHIGYSDLPGAGGHALAEHVEKVRDLEIEAGIDVIPLRADLKDPAVPLRVLYMENNNAKGLIGPEGQFEQDAERFKEQKHCFVGLCRGVGISEKDGGSGGTYGFGKVVNWRASSIGTVFFYSRLSVPYESDLKGAEVAHTRRLIGVNLLSADHPLGPGASWENYAFFGRHQPLDQYEGWDGQSITRALYDGEADELAKKLGMRVRGDGEPGLTTMIIGFYDPDDREADARKLLDGILESAEFFWAPKILEGGLVVKGRINGDPERAANPRSRSEMQPFVTALDRLRSGKPDDAEFTKRIFEISVPGMSDGRFVSVSKAKMVVAIVASDLEEGTPHKTQRELATPRANSMALIRGPGMVTAYQALERLGSVSKTFYAVVLAGDACVDIDGVDCDPDSQRHAELLFSLSEPVTHDRWSANSDRDEFKSWRGAKKALRDALRRVRQNIRDVVSKKLEPPKGDAAPMFAAEFDIGGPSSADRHRVCGLRGWHTTHMEGGRYRVSGTLSLPAAADVGLDGDPDRPVGWRLEVPAAFVREDGHPLGKDVPGRFETYDDPPLSISTTGLEHAARLELVIGERSAVVQGVFPDQACELRLEAVLGPVTHDLSSYGRLRAFPTVAIGMAPAVEEEDMEAIV